MIHIRKLHTEVWCGFAGIEGDVHSIRLLFDQWQEDEDWGFFITDARNAFNSACRKTLLVACRYYWPSGCTFAFNSYRHWRKLVVRTNSSTPEILYSMEGVTQGCPFAMYVYGVGTLPLFKGCQAANPDTTQPTYADDNACGGKRRDMVPCLQYLREYGGDYGYYPEEDKSSLVVHPSNVEAATREFDKLGCEVVTGKRYLGGFLGTRAELEAYVREKIVDWVDNVKVLSRAAKRYPQSAYCVFTKSLQAEWIYIQRILPGIGHLFAPLEEAIADVFIPALLGTVTIDPSDRSLYRDIFALPVRKCGLAIMDPTKTADAAFKASTVMTGY